MRADVVVLLALIGGCLYGIGYIRGKRQGFIDGIRRAINDKDKPIFATIVNLIDTEKKIKEIKKGLNK